MNQETNHLKTWKEFPISSLCRKCQNLCICRKSTSIQHFFESEIYVKHILCKATEGPSYSDLVQVANNFESHSTIQSHLLLSMHVEGCNGWKKCPSYDFRAHHKALCKIHPDDMTTIIISDFTRITHPPSIYCMWKSITQLYMHPIFLILDSINLNY